MNSEGGRAPFAASAQLPPVPHSTAAQGKPWAAADQAAPSSITQQAESSKYRFGTRNPMSTWPTSVAAAAFIDGQRRCRRSMSATGPEQ